jgi:ubiquinone/menaquinone biosynthesis C-methylase UbiE
MVGGIMVLKLACDETVQNIYDDPEFFAGYQEMRAAARGLHETTIRPALPDLLPELRGRRVVDLGCGDGWLSRLAAEAGAGAVLGLDPSERMLELARARTSDARVTYRRAFVEDAELPAASADVVLSVLALHYVADLDAAVARIAGWLSPGGDVVAIVEHPIGLATVPDRGFATTRLGRRAFLLHSYAAEGPRDEHWFIPGVRKYHRTVASLVNAFTGAGLRIERLAEPMPIPELVDDADMEDATARPWLLAVCARRPARAGSAD